VAFGAEECFENDSARLRDLLAMLAQKGLESVEFIHFDCLIQYHKIKEEAKNNNKRKE